MASHSLFMLAFVAAIYFSPCVNCIPTPQQPILGGWKNISVNDPGIQELVKDMSKIVPEFAVMDIIDVIHAQSALAAGMKYAVTVLARPMFSIYPLQIQECTIIVYFPVVSSRRLFEKLVCNLIHIPKDR